MARRNSRREYAMGNVFERMAADRYNAPTRAAGRYVPQAPTIAGVRKIMARISGKRGH